MVYSCRENPENIMRPREAVIKARGRMCAGSERREKCGEAEAGRDSRFGFFIEKTREMKQPELLKNQGKKIWKRGEERATDLHKPGCGSRS
jgi:hypothetical protein